MRQLLAITRREMYGMLTQRWILILLALLGMELLIGVGVSMSHVEVFDLSNVAVTMSFLGSLAVMGLSLDAVTKERSNSTLELILTRSIQRRQVILGKLLAYLLLSVPVGVLGIVLPMAVAAALGVRLDLDTIPLGLTLMGTVVYLAVYATLGVAVSLYCRTLQSAFAIGGALWVASSPLVWQFLVVRGLSRHLDEYALSWLNVLNPMGAYYSAIRPVEDFGPSNLMAYGAPTPVAYAVMGVELLAMLLFALVVFGRQEERGYQG